MSGKSNEPQAVVSGDSVHGGDRKRKLWWILPLLVLIVLVVIIYVLSHLSAADSEMYPTTMLRARQPTAIRLC